MAPNFLSLRQNFTRSLARVPGRLNKKKSQGPETVLDMLISQSYHYNTKLFISRKIQMRCQLFPFFWRPFCPLLRSRKFISSGEGRRRHAMNYGPELLLVGAVATSQGT